jgi:RHS repeat-associated protein
MLGLIGIFQLPVLGYYQPETGRFMQRDPLGVSPTNREEPIDVESQYAVGFNCYEYVRSNPILMKDPTGLIFLPPSNISGYYKEPCEGCSSSLVIMTRPLSQSDKQKKGWIVFGCTTDNWKYKSTTTKTGCCSDEKKVTVSACSLAINVWYIDPPEDQHDTKGNTPEQHERIHYDSLEALWSELTDRTCSITNTCMKSKRADCYAIALNSYSKYLNAKYSYEANKFDCEVYGGTVDNNINKRRVCNLSDENHKQKLDQLEARAMSNLNKCDNLKE